MKRLRYEKPVTEIKEVEAADIIVTSDDFDYGLRVSGSTSSGGNGGKLTGRLEAQYDKDGNLTSWSSI